MNFNKIKEMGVSAEDIGKAVSACSTQLCLSDDKYRVKRKSPYKPPENVDGRTVYVVIMDYCFPSRHVIDSAYEIMLLRNSITTYLRL